jgi:hypothetical protein
MCERLRVHSTPVDTSFERWHERHLIREAGDFEPLTDKIACDQVASGGMTVLEAEPSCY